MAAQKRPASTTADVATKKSKNVTKGNVSANALPVFSCKSRLLSYARRHSTLVLVGETGSGKTTQVPQMLLTLSVDSRIAVTQPRRVAAISVAARVAREMHSELGHTVGYRVRFERAVDEENTRLVYLTDGMLLREAMLDPTLSRYAWVVLDEVHERSIETDVLMAVVKRAQRMRVQKEPLKVVVMSATLDAAPIADFFCSHNIDCDSNGGGASSNQDEVAHYHGVNGGAVEASSLFKKKKKHKKKKANYNNGTISVYNESKSCDFNGDINKAFDKLRARPPILYILGRQHTIEIRHLRSTCDDWQRAVIETVMSIHNETSVDQHVLVFMTGQEEIEATAKQLRRLSSNMVENNKKKNETKKKSMEVFSLYASQQWQQQQRLFVEPRQGVRRVIVATNIAETSVTIPGIRHVVDSCRVKTKVHEASTGLDVLRVVRVSRAQATQRAGRAGRETDGRCYRLITKEEFERLPAETVPEILRCNLSSVLLHLLSIGVEDVEQLDFVQRPPDKSIKEAMRQLKLLGALDKTFKLTLYGQKLALFPLEPRLAKAVLCAEKLGCTEEVISIVALLSGDSVLLTAQSGKKEQIEAARKKFVSSEGDLITMLKMFKAYRAAANKNEWCNEHLVHMGRMRFALEVRSQLIQLCQDNEIAVQSCGTNTQNVCRAITQGLFTNVARLTRSGDYITVDTKQSVKLHPSSVLFSSKPEVVVFIELMITQRSYIRNITLVDPQWLLEAQPEYFTQNRLLNNVDIDHHLKKFSTNQRNGH